MRSVLLVLLLASTAYADPPVDPSDVVEQDGQACWAVPGAGGCNEYGCWSDGGGCNEYGCWHAPRGACNEYGCSEVGVCNEYGCPNGSWQPRVECAADAPVGDASCNEYGCWSNGGGCNEYGCWTSSYGSCDEYGCAQVGACNEYGCPPPPRHLEVRRRHRRR